MTPLHEAAASGYLDICQVKLRPPLITASFQIHIFSSIACFPTYFPDDLWKPIWKGACHQKGIHSTSLCCQTRLQKDLPVFLGPRSWQPGEDSLRGHSIWFCYQEWAGRYCCHASLTASNWNFIKHLLNWITNLYNLNFFGRLPSLIRLN